ncbi:hypothetical protein [Niveispirillum sp.]|uniref:hypothetical protein n=1 Tax=Niveispirillum sp. TaxID=1917217 RepID=UPI001B79F51E|nr:hypothetical protein [Niveispirillum sp.]MBP7340488.1 hypothetical protein [Niveispirillum sp.]
MSSNIYKDIIRQREGQPQPPAATPQPPPLPREGEYLAFRSGSRVQMGFAVYRANGDMDGFLYHNLDNLALRRVSGVEFLTFTHRGKAVTMQGQGLKAVMQVIMAHTAMEVFEHDGKATVAAEPVIQRVEVTMADKSGSKVGTGLPSA